MLKLAALGLLCAAFVYAEAPDMNGVWKADPEKSKFAVRQVRPLLTIS